MNKDVKLKLKSLLIRKNRVIAALDYLIANNPFYKDIKIDKSIESWDDEFYFEIKNKEVTNDFYEEEECNIKNDNSDTESDNDDKIDPNTIIKDNTNLNMDKLDDIAKNYQNISNNMGVD